MTQDEFNDFCRALPATNHVVQWRGADVWKVGAKVFAIARFEEDGAQIAFKVSPLGFEMMREQPGLRPAPYLASRGLLWIQHYDKPGLTDDELRAYLSESHRMIAAALPKKTRIALGLLQRPA
jgi:predicted DNA-binding protein (MmcQ/YjbR family)